MIRSGLPAIKRLTLHLLFWTGIWFFYYYFFSYNSSDKTYITWFSTCLLPLTMGVTYFVKRVLIPEYLLTRKYQLFALYSFYTLVASSYIIVLTLYGCLIFLLRFNVSIMPPMSKNFFFILILVYTVVGVVCFISVLNHNFQTESRNKELQNKILATQLQLKEQELHYLKRQIHPHFLFNTLNTIYGFALKQSTHTPEIILKLSNLLDYILYQINKPKVSLKEEVLHIKEYVELEKMRFQDTLKIRFLATDIDPAIQVAPMLLIPFVENAFKHGEIVEGYLRIEVEVQITGEGLEFSMGNSVKQAGSSADHPGIGLENIRKRLDLHYKDGYQLTNEVLDHWYLVKLSIFELNSIRHV